MPTDRPADWLPFADARARVVAGVQPSGTERRPLPRCLGYVLAEEVHAPLDLPPWDNSAMDGFAVRAQDVAGATAEHPRELRVVDDIPAGSVPSAPLIPGTAARVMTGAPVPAGADSVIRVEHTADGRADSTPDWRIRIISDTDGGRNIRRRGEDISHGSRVLPRERLLRPAELGVAASVGRAELKVVRRPVVGVLASGDELVRLDRFGEVMDGRRIVSSNTYTLAAQLEEIGIAVRDLGIAADDSAALRAGLERARGCDALITSAGISMGEHDLVRAALEEMDVRVDFWRVRMRPGSPFAFGWVGDLGGIPWFGLPGNPVSSMVTFEVLVRPALLRMCGRREIFAPTAPAVLDEPYPAAPGLTHFARVRLSAAETGLRARLTGTQGSGVLTSMATADALLVVPEDGGAAPGNLLRALLLGGAPLREAPGY